MNHTFSTTGSERVCPMAKEDSVSDSNSRVVVDTGRERSETDRGEREEEGWEDTKYGIRSRTGLCGLRVLRYEVQVKDGDEIMEKKLIMEEGGGGAIRDNYWYENTKIGYVSFSFYLGVVSLFFPSFFWPFGLIWLIWLLPILLGFVVRSLLFCYFVVSSRPSKSQIYLLLCKKKKR